MMLALAPSIVSRMNDCHKISNYPQNTDPERNFISFSDNESEQKVIDTIERDMRPFKRVNHDGVAIFKNDILIHSSIKELLLSENSNIESKSFGELRNTIGSLDELAITSKYH